MPAAPPPPSAQSRPDGLWRLWIWPVLLLALSLLAWLLPWRDWVPVLRAWVETHGALGWAVYVAVYAFVVILPLPAAAMSVVGGLAFGWWGFVLAMAGSLIGSLPPFWAVQRWLRGPVLRRFPERQVAAADRAVRRNGFVFVALLRLTPILPFTLQNYLLGLTPVPTRTYLWATLIGLAPGTLGMVWLGEMGGLAAAETGATELAIAGAGLVAFGALIVWLSWRAVVILRESGFDLQR